MEGGRRFFAFGALATVKWPKQKSHIEPFGSKFTHNPACCHRQGGSSECALERLGLATRRHTATNRGLAARFAAVACASVIAVSCVTFGVASAGNSSRTEVAEFGLSAAASATPSAYASPTISAAPAPASGGVSSTTFTSGSAAYGDVSEGLVLESAAKRDVSKGFQEIAAEEEAARIAAEEAARAEEQRHIAIAAAAKAAAAAIEAPVLPDVDFTCGKAVFVAEWTVRIDAYLHGSPLAGYGSVFAEAAWENGVDPRWSPAISNTESTKGRHCFRAYNAWGWMAESWSSWEEAINAHVAGLASGYGYSISVANAKKYCPPTYLDWYAKTVNEMAKI